MVAARQILVLYFVITIEAVQELNVFVKTSIVGVPYNLVYLVDVSTSFKLEI